MFFISLLTSLYMILCLMIIFLVLVQRGKGGMGLGNMGGGNQMLFGSSGGQDLFQKATWVMCALLLSGALVIGVLKTKYRTKSISYTREVPEAVQSSNKSDESDNS
jgi:protein translocase SecG subunit